MDENTEGSNDELKGNDEEKVKELESDLEEIIDEEKSKPEDPTSNILTGVKTEASTVKEDVANNKDNTNSGFRTSENIKTDVNGFPTDIGGKQNVQDPIPSMVDDKRKSEDEKIKILLKIAIVIFVVSLLILSAYIIGARKEENGRRIKETPLPVMTNTPSPASASPSASISPSGFLEESTPSSFLQTATPSGSSGL